MEYQNVVLQLKNIAVDQDKYNKKGDYYTFIQTRNNYLARAGALSPLEETMLLFKMLDCLDKWIVIHNKKGEKRYTPFLSNILLARKNALMTSVPKILHFVCLCEITDIQRDYINLWIQANPDYAIRICTDKYSLLAKELAVRLQKKASEEALQYSINAFPTILFRWQSDAFSYIRRKVASTAKDGIENSFDNCVKAYCQERGLASAEVLSTICEANRTEISSTLRELKRKNPKTDIQFNISEQIFIPWPSNYLTELVLRSNLITASDLLGLEMLQKEGGIYLATTLLPAIDKNLFHIQHRSLIQTSLQDPHGTQSIAVIISLILDKLMEEYDPQTGVRKPSARANLLQDYPIYDIHPKKRAEIKEAIKNAQKKQQKLFIGLGEIKVDPVFQCSYAEGNISAVAAQKLSDNEENPFLAQLLANFNKAYNIIEKYNHYGFNLSMPALWQPIIPDIEAEIKSANLCLSAKAVLNYRWDILNQYEQSSAELLGTSAYDFVYSQLLEKILGTTPEAQGEKVFITHPSTFQKRYTPSFSAVTMLTEEVLLSHLMGRMHYLQPFANSPQYGGQYIIQLYSDQLSVQAAQFLYNQNRDVSDWYQYDTAENKLVLHPAVATTAARVNKGKYIILLGNGSPMSERYMKKIIKLLKEIILPIDISTIEQVTLLGCQLHKGDGIAVKDNLIFSIESLYDAFDKHQRKINVGQIVVQDKLFFIDIMGRKWQGKLYAEGNNHVAIQAAINWKEAIENDQEAVVARSTDGLTLSYQTRSFGEDMQINNKIITMNNVNPTPFSLGSVMEIPIIHPEKHVAWMKDPTKLDGWLDFKTAQEMLKEMEQGVVVTVAESMALIAAMGKVDHEIIINDPDLYKIATVMRALEQSIAVETYADWYEILDFSCSKIAFNQLINTLFPTPLLFTQAFNRLQWRVRGKRITFFNLNLNKYGSATNLKRWMKSKIAIKAIFLGSTESLLLFDKKKNDQDHASQVEQVTSKVESIETNLTNLDNTGQPPYFPFKRYYYSLWDPKFSLQQPLQQQHQPILLKNYFNNNYIDRAQQLDWQAELHPSLIMADNYTRKRTWKRLNQEELHKNGLAQEEWMLLFSTLEYDPLDKKFTVSYLNTKNYRRITIATHNPIFAEMKIYLDKNAELIKQNYQLTKRKNPTARTLGRMGGVGSFANFDDSVISIYHFFKKIISSSEDKDKDKDKDNLNTALELYIWISVVADFNNLLSFPSTLAEGAARLAHSSAESNRLLQYFPGTIASFLNYSDEIYRSKFIQDLSASTTTASFILNFVSLGVNTNLAIEAKNDRQRSLAITRIAFDSVSFLFSIWSWRAMLATEGFSPLLTVIAAGYGLAWISEKISNFLDENIDNITLTQNIGNFFNQLKKGFERGGFNLINNELLAPVEGVVIKDIHLEDISMPKVIFDNIGVQIRKKTDQGQDLVEDSNDPDAYLNLSKLSGVVENQQVAIADLSGISRSALETLILPWSPRVKINPSYEETDFIAWRNDREFDALRYFAAKDPHFVFEYYQHPTPVKELISPVLTGIRESVGVGWMAINKLQSNYEKTEVNVYFGNNDYKLMAPGIKENEKISESVCKNYLHYRFYGPEVGGASIFLALNRGQADITIERSNPDVTWIINANHHYLPDMYLRPTHTGCILSDRQPDKQGEKNTITININQRDNTTLTFQLPLGVVTTDLTKDTQLIIREFNAKSFMSNLTPYITHYLDPEGKTKRMSPTMKKATLLKRYLQFMTTDKTVYPRYIPIQEFSLTGDEDSHDVYYSVHNEEFIHTKNQPGTLFEDTHRSNIQVIFLNEKYAWFKGDLLMHQFLDDTKPLYLYRNLVWVSDIETNTLKHIYFPFCHIPDVLDSYPQAEQEKIKYASQSTIHLLTQPKDIIRYIDFEQTYCYKQQQDHEKYLSIRYKIDTRYPEKGLLFAAADNLPEEIQDQLIESRNISALNQFMKINTYTEVKDLSYSVLDPWNPTGQNIKTIDNVITDTIFSAGSGIIWPLQGSVEVKGHVQARLPDNVLNNPNDIISYAGTTTKMLDSNARVKGVIETIHYHFWCIHDKNKNVTKLYAQQDNRLATKMHLSDFNIHQVLNIDNTIISTEDGLLYGLEDDKTIVLSGIGQRWLLKKGNWWISFRHYIDTLTKRMTGLLSLPAEQTKPIHIAPYLTFSGLVENKEKKPLSVWYDVASQQFFICKNNENQRIFYLGIDNENKNGAWLLKIENDNENVKEIAYVTSIKIDELSLYFQGIILKKEEDSQQITPLPEWVGSSSPISFIQVKLEREGIKGTTTDGLVLNVSRKNKGFNITLLTITPLFSDTLKVKENASITPNSDDWKEIQKKIKQLVQHYAHTEIIKLKLNHDQQGWYYVNHHNLFLPFSTHDSTGIKIHNLDHCLGYNSQHHYTYFNSQQGEQKNLIKMGQDGRVMKIVYNKGTLYQRTSSLLILDPGSVSVLTDDDYVNVDVPALLITSHFDQTENGFFTFQVEKFFYPVIYLIHTNLGKLQCIMPSTPEELLITQKGWSISLIIEKNLLMLFASDNQKKANLEFIFRGITVPATGLSTYYIPLEGHAAVGSIIDVSISLLALETYYYALYPHEDKKRMDGHLSAPFPKFSA